MKKYLIPSVIVILNIIVITAIAILYRGNRTLIAENNKLKNDIKASAKTLSLPSSAVKISECIPHMGEHWIVPSDLPHGPIYTVDKGKVLALEYMLSAKDIPGEAQAKMTLEEFTKYMKDNNLSFADSIHDLSFPLNGMSYDHVAIEWSAPHAGFPEPHYDIHVYMANESMLENVCPDAKIENVYSPEIFNTIKEHNIPFPGLPEKH